MLAPHEASRATSFPVWDGYGILRGLLARSAQKRGGSNRIGIADEQKAHDKRLGDQMETVLREQKEVEDLVTAPAGNLAQTWHILTQTFDEGLSARDPATAVYLLRWLKSGFHWLTHMSTLSLTLSWGCELWSQKRRRMREREMANLLCVLARPRAEQPRRALTASWVCARRFPITRMA